VAQLRRISDRQLLVILLQNPILLAKFWICWWKGILQDASTFIGRGWCSWVSQWNHRGNMQSYGCVICSTV
jgi:hypothetical protein